MRRQTASHRERRSFCKRHSGISWFREIPE